MPARVRTPTPPSMPAARAVDLEVGALRRDNERLERERQHLEHISQQKSQFLANLSHEFRAPLTAILGYTSMTLDGISGEVPPALRRNLDRIDRNARHLLGLINEVLDLSRIEAGRMPVRMCDFNVGELIGEVLAQLEPLITCSRLDVRADVAHDLPALHSDRQKVKQIVLNLLTNALKFTHVGRVVVRARATEDRQHTILEVEDTGIGIAKHDLARIFDDFRQAAAIARTQTGTGLGLAVSNQLAIMLGGTLGVVSALGKGSTFTLMLPRRARS